MPTNIISDAINLGVLSASPITNLNFVGDSDTSDFFQFNLTDASNINLSLANLFTKARVRLIRDVNGNGVVDSGDVVASSFSSASDQQSINLSNQAPGTYFAQVYQSSGNTNYTLRLSNSSISNLISPMDNLGALTSAIITRFNFLADSRTSSIFQFSLTSASNINLALIGLGADANLRIIRDVNGNGIIDGTDVVTTSARAGTTSESININSQAAGNYFAQVYQSSGSTNYLLHISTNITSNLIAPEENLGAITNSGITRFESIGNSDTSDIYQFNLTNASDINLALTGINANANVRIVRDANNNGIVDSTDVVASSNRVGLSNESINLNSQAAGTYFAQVYQSGSASTRYTLRLSNNSVSNLLLSEDSLGFIGAGITARSGSVGNSDTSDMYRFSLSSARTVTAHLSGLSANADLRIIHDGNNNGVVDAGEVVGSSTNSGTTVDVVSRFLGAGNYFVQAYQFSGDTNYSLVVSA